MPPGIGDATLDLIRLIRNIEFLIITTPSQLAFETVRKLTSLLKELKIPIIGVIENMKMDKSKTIREETRELGLAYLTTIAYDPKVEETIGNVSELTDTTLANEIKKITVDMQ
jgi:ATP-binding protein involved in chromosome partitioning